MSYSVNGIHCSRKRSTDSPDRLHPLWQEALANAFPTTFPVPLRAAFESQAVTIKFVRQTHEKLIPIIEIQRIERQLNEHDSITSACMLQTRNQIEDLLVMIICGDQICTSDQLFRYFQPHLTRLARMLAQRAMRLI